MNRDEIVIVSGLPRSGTSMMMKMLEAGGIPVLIDGIRVADEDNPKGYYEFERVKQVKEDQSWLADAPGKVVKMVSMLLKDLPKEGYRYKVVFMRRKMEEILASQKQMLVRNNKPTDAVPDAKMAELFEKHLKDIFAWLEKQPQFDVLYINYNEMLVAPQENITAINAFLGGTLNTTGMQAVIDKNLYRQRK
ncbi:MAG: sulfotransferase domain-containing protein [Blastocatellia bacterium]|nr:sulfotransferase domain-containing protein [Blastocatellia bacterium]